jgi:hypothetical protein
MQDTGAWESPLSKPKAYQRLANSSPPKTNSSGLGTRQSSKRQGIIDNGLAFG